MATPAGALLGAALAVLIAMFACNTDYGGDPTSPRGDGTYRPVLARGDGHMMYLMARSLVMDGDLIFDNDLARFGDPWRQPRTETGRKMIPHPIGPALVWAPLLAAAHGLSKIANAVGAEIPSHGYDMFHQRIVFFSSVLFAFGATLLGFLIARRWVGGRWAPVYGAIAILFGTSLVYYGTYMPSYAHAMDACACAAFVAVWATTLGDWRWRRFVFLGVLLGLCALIRVTGFALGSAVAVEVLAAALRPAAKTSRLRHAAGLLVRGAVTLGVAAVVFVPQMIAWKLLFGHALVSPMGPRFVRLDHPQILEVLFSSRNGWLSTNPLAYAGVVGLAFVPRRARLISLGLVPAVVLMVWVNSAAGDWWGGAAVGNRRLCSLTVVLIIGLAALLRAAGLAARRLPPWSRQVLAILVLGWFVTWNMTQVARLRFGRAANSSRRTCCRYQPRALAALAQPIYDRIGNPFALPASAYYAARYGISLSDWDRVVGEWADRPDLTAYNDGTYRKRRDVWPLASERTSPWVVDGFGPIQKDGRARFRWTTADTVRVLVPLWLSDARTFTLTVWPNVGPGDAPMRVTVSVNGRRYIDDELGAGATTLHFTVPEGELGVGLNELAIRAPVRVPAAGRAGHRPAPHGGGPVGLAVRDLVLSFPSPPAPGGATRHGGPP